MAGVWPPENTKFWGFFSKRRSSIFFFTCEFHPLLNLMGRNKQNSPATEYRLYSTTVLSQLARTSQSHPHALVPWEAVVTSFSHLTLKHILTLRVNLVSCQAETPCSGHYGARQLVLLESMEHNFYENSVSLGCILNPALQMRNGRTETSSDFSRNIQVGFGRGAV